MRAGLAIAVGNGLKDIPNSFPGYRTAVVLFEDLSGIIPEFAPSLRICEQRDGMLSKC